MTSEIIYNNFLSDKRAFFTTPSLDVAVEKSTHQKYKFLARNNRLIEQEFNDLYAVLKESDEKEFWHYCYYCCLMLENYYKTYRHGAKERLYKNLKKKIENQLKGHKEIVITDPFIKSIGKGIADELKNLVARPIGALRDKAAFYNLWRIYWYFCSTFSKKSFYLARDLHWLEKLSSMLHKEIDVDELCAALEVPGAAFRAFGVGFCVGRLIINFGMVLKHCLSKKENSLSTKERFMSELYKRHADFLNDIVWATVNSLSNYNQVFGISSAVAGWLVAGFMLFDLSLILWRRHLAKREYLIKKEQYEKEIANNQQEGAKTSLANLRHCEILQAQLKELEMKWQAISATFLFDATAAVMLGMGFSASMLFFSPALVIGSFFVCVVAMAMYLSDNSYNNFMLQRLRLQDAKIPDGSTLKAYKTARHDFILTMLENTLMPSLIIVTVSIYWPAAVLLTSVFIGYKVWNAYSKHPKCNSSDPTQKLETINKEPAQKSNFEKELIADNDPCYTQGLSSFGL